ncbi:CRISPR-associated endoribonuclease Cas6, partial [Sulfolobus sp. E3]
MLLAEVYVSPENNAIIPPFSSKVGKTLLINPKNVAISPLKYKGKYFIKYSEVPTYLEVFPSQLYSFEVGGDEDSVTMALAHLEDRKVFNTLWRVKDVVVSEIEIDGYKKIELEVLTPALLVNPFIKSKRKIFTNRPSVVFFNNLIDVTGLKRGEEKLNYLLNRLDHLLWEDPSIVKYAKVVYAGKEVIGLVGKLRYSLTNEDDIVYKVLESVASKGIGSSRRNGFGR